MKRKLPLMQRTLEEMFNEGHFADVTFETEINDRTQAHRCVLATISPVFRAMFSVPMMEETTKTVRINDMTTCGLRAFFRILYTGWLECDHIQMLGRELLAASHKYQISEVTKIVSAALFSTITVDNCVTMFEHGSLYDETLECWCKTFIFRNWKLVVCTPEFNDLIMRKPSLQLDLVKSIALDDRTRELRVSFRGDTTKMRMDRSCTVSEIINDLRVQISQPALLLQIVGVVDHRIDRTYQDHDTVGDLPIFLKAEEARPETEVFVRVSHMLASPNGTFYKYFGEPFTVRGTFRAISAKRLALPLLRFLEDSNLSKVRFALRRCDAPHDPAINYLLDTNIISRQSLVKENEFLAIVHSTCGCSVSGIHSHVFHFSRYVVFY